MKTDRSRRVFLKNTAVAGTGFLALAGNQPKPLRASALQGIAVAGIGVGGKGGSDIQHAGMFGKVVALCDVDKNTLAGAGNNFPGAKTYVDFRDLFAEMEDKFDAVTVGTTDHMHCPITAMALKAKKHCYTQKPLTRTIAEARYLEKLAVESGVCTQMGNQGSVDDALRRDAAQLRGGVVGTVKEVHTRTDRPIWPQKPNRDMTMEKFIAQVKEENPDDKDLQQDEIAEKKKQIAEAMSVLDWDRWIGVAPYREFWPGLYHPFSWRGWWDFGTGALGDMGCHQVNRIFKGVDLRNPVSVTAISSGHDFISFPGRSICKFEFPANDWRGPVTFTWYDSSQGPSPDILAPYNFPADATWDNGSLIIGDKGAMLIADNGYHLRDNEGKELPALPESALDYVIAPTDNRATDGDIRHKLEWMTAISEGKPELCWSNFPNHAGPLTETILLGNLAIWAAAKPDQWGEKVEWDAESMIVTNLDSIRTPGVADLIRPRYPEGYDNIEI